LRLAALILLLLPLSACGPSADDARKSLILMEAVETAPLEIRTRLLFKGCSELRTCAQGCKRAFASSADANADSAERATLLASCNDDYRKRREAGEKLSAEAWLEQHWHTYLDAAREHIAEADRAAFDAARAKAKL
jgi:hypothetical protein